MSAIHSPSAPGHRASGDIDWQVRSFDQIDGPALYQLLALRSQVFVVEQNCIFQDIDGADPLALHLLGSQGGQLVAYARCFPAGVKFAEASIGRVLTRRTARGTGLGHALDVGSGALLPTTSVDQYGATLAKWFGVAPAAMTKVFPNLGNFATPDLGFMA